MLFIVFCQLTEVWPVGPVGLRAAGHVKRELSPGTEVVPTLLPPMEAPTAPTTLTRKGLVLCNLTAQVLASIFVQNVRIDTHAKIVSKSK